MQAGCNAAACHAQMYIMGTRPAARLGSAEGDVPAEDRQRRAAPAGVRRHRADQRHRHHGAAHRRPARGRPLRRQRPEGLDQPRRALRPDAAARPHDAARAGEEAHRRPLGLPRRHARGGRHGLDHPPDPHHDEPQQRPRCSSTTWGAGGEPDRRGGQRLPLHPRRHERRAHADRLGVHRRRASGSSTRPSPMRASAWCSAGRSARTRACSSRSRAPMRRCGRPT